MGIERISEFWPAWRPLELLGKGGNGEVYKCIHEEMGVTTYSAIKVINISSSQMTTFTFDTKSIHSFCRNLIEDCVNEINVMLSLKNCPNIVAIEDFKVVEIVKDEEWEIFIRMELLTCLTDYLKDRVLSQDEIVKLGIDLCSALELCHSKNIMHRDIKPANIFVNELGDFKLGDFGIARTLEMATAGFSKKGTITYVAPEVMHSNDYTKTVDIYSLGLVLYQLANNNRLPFLPSHGEYTHTMQHDATITRLKGDAFPPACNADEELNSIFRIACEYEPKNRFQSAEQMKKALETKCYNDETVKLQTQKLSVDATVKIRHMPDAYDENFHQPESVVEKRTTIQCPNEVNTYNKKNSRMKPAVVTVIILGVILMVVMIIVGVIFVTSNSDDSIDEQQSGMSVVEDDTDQVSSDYKNENDDSADEYDSLNLYNYAVSYDTPDHAGIVARSESTYYSDKIAVLAEGTPVQVLNGFAEGTEYIHIAFDLNGVRTEGWVLGKYIVDEDLIPYHEVKEYKVGDIVQFGSYEQDGNIKNGKEPIEWVVLEVQEGSYLMISKYAIDSMPYNNIAGAVTWETSDIREWLNVEFYKTAFDEISYGRLIKMTFPSGHKDGHYVNDSVGLLSQHQVNRYFSTEGSAKTTATKYAQINGAYTKNGYCGWWLIDNGDSADVAARVNIYGEVLTSDSAEGGVERTDYAVRPVILVDYSEFDIEDSEYNIPVSFEQEKTNIYVSNITESGIGEFIGTPSVDELLKFAMNHSILNYNPAVSGIEYRNYSLSGMNFDVRINAEYVDSLAFRFFGINTNTTSMNDARINSGYLYGSSTGVKSSGIAFVSNAFSNSAKDKYKLYFSIYQSDSDDESVYYSYSPSQAELDTSLDYSCDGYVIIQKYNNSGKEAYKIIEYKKN